MAFGLLGHEEYASKCEAQMKKNPPTRVKTKKSPVPVGVSGINTKFVPKPGILDGYTDSDSETQDEDPGNPPGALFRPYFPGSYVKKEVCVGCGVKYPFLSHSNTCRLRAEKLKAKKKLVMRWVQVPADVFYGTQKEASSWIMSSRAWDKPDAGPTVRNEYRHEKAYQASFRAELWGKHWRHYMLVLAEKSEIPDNH
jgi:hypothetical protein